MPRYVWVAELSTKSNFDHGSGEHRAIGEIVFDSTANAYANNPYIVLHLPGLILTKMRDRSFVQTLHAESRVFNVYSHPVEGGP